MDLAESDEKEAKCIWYFIHTHELKRLRLGTWREGRGGKWENKENAFEEGKED